MKLEIKPMNNQYRILFNDFDEYEQDLRLYWFEDYPSLSAAEQRVSELKVLNGTE